MLPYRIPKKSSVIKLNTLLVLVLLTASACVKHQYLTLESSLPLDKKTGYVQEQDSIQIYYRFSGDNCPLQLEIRNNSQTPAYIDWSKSSIIFNGITLPFSQGISNISLTGQSVSYSSPPYSVNSFAVNGQFNVSGSSSTFIPPSTGFRPRVETLTTKFFKLPKGKKILVRDTIGHVAARKNEFSKADTPFKFQTYITVIRAQRTLTFNDEFWVGEALTTKGYITLLDRQPHIYTVSRLTSTGGVMAVLGTTVVATVLVLGNDE